LIVGNVGKKKKNEGGPEPEPAGDKLTGRDIEEAKKKRKLFLRAKVKAAERFAAAARQKLGHMVKGVAVIGSIARGDFTPGSDIDVLVVIDDTRRDVPDELKEKLLAMLNKMGKGIDKKMQVQIHTLTELFKFATGGDNIIYNFLRHMDIVYDGGVLKPMRKLLKSGEIKPTKESVMRSMDGAEFYMKKVNQYVEWIVERYYRAITWASNAFVMSMEQPPAAVPEIPLVLKKYADQGVLPQEVPAIAAEVIQLHKAVEHGDVEPTMDQIHELKPRVDSFLEVIRKEVVGSVVEEGLKGSVKAKIKTMPKIIFEFSKGRAFAWLLQEGVFVAHYKGDKLDAVYKSKVEEGEVEEFKKVKHEELFKAMESSELKPLINPDLIRMIYRALPGSVRKKPKKVAIEYPGRAMVDLDDAISLE